MKRALYDLSEVVGNILFHAHSTAACRAGSPSIVESLISFIIVQPTESHGYHGKVGSKIHIRVHARQTYLNVSSNSCLFYRLFSSEMRAAVEISFLFFFIFYGHLSGHGMVFPYGSFMHYLWTTVF